MGRETGARLGWQGWLWLAILAICLAALSLGIGFGIGIESSQGSAGPISAVGTVPAGDPPATIDLFPTSSRPRPDSIFASADNSTTPGGGSASSVLQSSAVWPTTDRPTTVSTTARRSSSVSTTTVQRSAVSPTTRRQTTISATTAAAQPVRLASTATPSTGPPPSAAPSTRATTTTSQPTTTTTSRPTTTTTSKPTTTTTRWSGPVAVDDHAVTDEGKEVKPQVLDNDTPGDSPLDKDTLSITAGPANARDYKVHDDHLHYKPADGFIGVDRIRYRICDEAGRCDTATVTITVG